MSFQTGTNVEALFTNDSSGTAYSNSTTETPLNDVPGMGSQAYLPAGFFLPSSARKSIKVVARGVCSSAASAPGTFAWQLRLASAAGGITGAIALGCVALTPTVSLASAPWEFEGDFTSAENVGTATPLRGQGLLTIVGNAAPITALWGNAASPGTGATFDPSLPYYLSLTGKFSAASASNVIQCLNLQVLGLN